MKWVILFAWAPMVFLLAACESAIDKPAALDPKVRKLAALEKRLPKASQHPPRLTPGPHWLDRLAPGEQIVFAGYRPRHGVLQFVLVLNIDPSADRLVLWPLPGNGTPIALWSEAAGREQIRKVLAGWQLGEQPAGAIELPLGRTFADKRLGPPLPTPSQVYAVAANYLSHLINDLAVQESDIRRPLLSRAPTGFCQVSTCPSARAPPQEIPLRTAGPFRRHPPPRQYPDPFSPIRRLRGAGASVF